MDEKKSDYFKEKLLQKQFSLQAMVQRTEGYGREKEPDIQDAADMAVEAYTKEFMFGKSSADRKILGLIRDALLRIEKSSFGVCLHCEEPIGTKRLEAVPWTQYCLECQSLLEKGLLDSN
jgi:DnaK suppressor protein